MPFKPMKPNPSDYELLGVTPRVDEEGLKKAYRQKVKIWHPDRFEQKESRERLRAEERFKAVNGAYQRILMDLRHGDRVGEKASKNEAEGKGEKPPEPPPPREKAPKGKGPAKGKPREGWKLRAGRWLRPAMGAWGRLSVFAEKVREKRKIALLCVLVSLFLYANWDLLFVRDAPSRGDWHGSLLPGEGAGGKDRTEIAPLQEKGEQAEDEPSAAREPEEVAGERKPAPEGFFSMGSTREEVLAAQGPPDSVRGGIWSYGLSKVVFKEGRVKRYSNFDGNLKVRLAPGKEKGERGSRPFFTLGSTRDEVLAVQGTPARIMGNRWQYGFSEIRFREGRVIAYDNFFGDLKVRLLPSTPLKDDEIPAAFSLGATRDEVLAVQGTPSGMGGNMWFYGLSSIQFRDGRVRAVYDPSGELRFEGAEGKGPDSP